MKPEVIWQFYPYKHKASSKYHSPKSIHFFPTQALLSFLEWFYHSLLFPHKRRPLSSVCLLNCLFVAAQSCNSCNYTRTGLLVEAMSTESSLIVDLFDAARAQGANEASKCSRPYRGRLAPSPSGELHLGHAQVYNSTSII